MSEVAFQKWLILNSRSNRTIQDRLKILRVLLRELPDWNKSSVDEFLIKLKVKGGRTNTTLNTYVDTVRTYAKCMGYSFELQNYKYFKREPVFKQTVSDEEIEKFINLECPKGCNLKQWNQANLFFATLAYTGCRPHEIATLKKAQVSNGLIVLVNTKTHKPRNVPLKEPVNTMLLKHIDSIDTENLFITSKGQVYSDHFWIHAFNKRKILLGINRPHLTCYTFRHSLATQLLRIDTNVHKVAKLLGNSVQQITESYEHLVVEDVSKALDRHPLIKKHLGFDKDIFIDEIVKVSKEHNLDANTIEKIRRFIYNSV